MSTFDPYALECLAAIVKEGSFERAAVFLSITQSAVSQRLRALEEQAGAVLVVRSRPIAPTPAGSLLLRHAMHMRMMGADVQHDLQHLAGGAQGRDNVHEQISVAIDADSMATWAMPALDHLPYQGQTLEIITDHLDSTPDLLRQGRALGCVSTLKQSMPGCKILALGTMHYVAVAHPLFAARHCPHGLTPHNFRSLPFVAFNRRDDLQREFVAHAFGLKLARIRQLFVPSLEGQIRAVSAQWGISVVPELYVRAQLREGQLVNLAAGETLPVDLFWHCWGVESGTLAALTTAFTKAADNALGSYGEAQDTTPKLPPQQMGAAINRNVFDTAALLKGSASKRRLVKEPA